MGSFDRNRDDIRRPLNAVKTIEIKLDVFGSYESCVLKLSDIDKVKKWETVKQNGHVSP